MAKKKRINVLKNEEAKVTANIDTLKKDYTALKERYKSAYQIWNAISSTRQALSQGISTSHDGARDYNQICGYPEDLTYADYLDTYERGDIASRIIDAPVSAVWATAPVLYTKDKANDNTTFNRKWVELVDRLSLWQVFRKADKLARLGRYSVIYLGYSGSDLSTPVKLGSDLAYIHAYSEDSAIIESVDNDITSVRYGLPVYYQINATIEGGIGGIQQRELKQTRVHYSRVMHICRGNLTSNIYGTPALQKVYNRLIDLVKVVGGSAEMFWRGARPGYVATADATSTFLPEDIEDMQNQLEDFDNNLIRWLRLKGIDVNSLEQQIHSPREHFDVLTSCIACAVGMPQRILIGAESGELASSMDEKNWQSRILEERDDYAEPVFIRQFVSNAQKVGVLPKGKYDIKWKDIATLSEKDKAEIAYKKSIALQNYYNSPTAPLYFPSSVFARTIMGLDEEDAMKIIEETSKWTELAKKKAELEVKLLESQIKTMNTPQPEQEQGDNSGE